MDQITESSMIPPRNNNVDTLPVRFYGCYEHHLPLGDKLVKSVSACMMYMQCEQFMNDSPLFLSISPSDTCSFDTCHLGGFVLYFLMQ